MNSYGGFIGLEIPLSETGPGLHPSATVLASGRACLSVLLSQIKPHRIHVPYYICDTVINLIRSHKVEILSYEIDDRLLPKSIPQLARGELLLVVQYFGLCSSNMAAYRDSLPNQVVFDRTQAFFTQGIDQSWSFNSARKFFGVSDGAFLSGPLEANPLFMRLTPSTQYLKDRADGKDAYAGFLENEKTVGATPYRISKISEEILSRIDYINVAKRRRENFEVYHTIFSSKNQLKISLGSQDVPLYYPLLTSDEALREKLAKHKIFCPTLWKECATNTTPGYEWEKKLARNLAPLPLDQRYTREDCVKIAASIQEIGGTAINTVS